MSKLSSSYGSYTPVFIKYKNSEEILKESRNGPYTKEAKKLIYDFTFNNNVEIEEININQLSCEEFNKLFYYTDIHQFLFRYHKYCGPEPYVNALCERVKKLKNHK